MWRPASAAPQCESTQDFTLGLQLRLFTGAIFSTVVPEKHLGVKGVLVNQPQCVAHRGLFKNWGPFSS